MPTEFDYLVSFPGLGINDLEVSRIAFRVFSIPVYWYGLLIASAILVCLFLAMRQSRYFRLTADDILDTFIAIIPGMIIFARLYYVVFEWEFYKTDWKLIFDTRAGGLAFYGGVIGGVLAALIVTRIKKIPFYRMADFLAVYIPLGQAIGRWGNFFNQEAFGSNTNLPWGMISDETTRYIGLIGQVGIDPSLPVHPTFLYEFIANMLLFVILFQIRRRTRQPYAVLLSYLLGYGFVRFFVESIRTDALYIPGTELRISMLLSAAMVIFSIIGLIVGKKLFQKKSQKEDHEEIDQSLIDFDIRGENEPDGNNDGSTAFIEIEDLTDQSKEN
jgi:phosphatidylglycerol:prolipoprotein diacylglycerol transferase